MTKNKKTNKPKGLFAVRYSTPDTPYGNPTLLIIAANAASAVKKARKCLKKTVSVRTYITEVNFQGTIDVF